MQVTLNTTSLESYRQFLAIKRLPAYTIRGHLAEFPDEYASLVGVDQPKAAPADYSPSPDLWDYQAAISRIAINKRKYAAFCDCGLGKTRIFLEFAKAAAAELGRRRGVLIVSPLMVVTQTIDECRKFYGDSIPLEQVHARDLNKWLRGCGGKIGITNYDAVTPELRRGKLGALILDESSMLKSHYGKWGTKCLDLGKGLDWKFAGTGTPAPNDRIEYANHAVFLDHFPTVNAFLATYFVNRGQTDNRWELKPHALRPFYRALSHWSIFLTNPATYGWKDNAGDLPPIEVHHHHVPLTDEQRQIVGTEGGELFATKMGGITSRSVMGQIAKGCYRGKMIDSNKPAFIRGLIESCPDESGLVWCIYNHEQERLAKELPMAASITGATPFAERQAIIKAFKSGEVRWLISKSKILGFGLNLQIATEQIFSGLQDSYESYYQCIKRSNRYGATRPLRVHLPMTDVEEPMIETVLRKAKRVQHDTNEQELLFKEMACL